MGQHQSLQTEVEIARSPEQVRRIMLDFASWPEWNTGVKISTVDESKPAAALKPGDKIKTDLGGFIMYPVLIENSEDGIAWRAGIRGLMLAHHYNYFRPSTKNPGNTVLVQIEEFTGLLAFLFAPGRKQRIELEGRFDTFNKEVKTRVESTT